MDCMNGSFCFEGLCVIQCSQRLDIDCDSGYSCDVSRGRCVSTAYIQALNDVDAQIEAAGDTLSLEDQALMRAKFELLAKKESNVHQSVIGQTAWNKRIENITFSERMPSAKIIDLNDATQKVSFSTQESIGDVQYVVKMKGDKLPLLKTIKGVRNSFGGYTYTFEIETAKITEIHNSNNSHTGSTTGTETETLEIVSNAGNFPLILAFPVTMARIYEGYVTPDLLSGLSFPIRMGITSEAGDNATFDEIYEEEPYLLLPVSSSDIFSPENVNINSTETWAKVKLRKLSAGNCYNYDGKCLSAVFSTNDFAPEGSVIIDADQKINRTIRIDINDYDSSSMTFSGTIRDIFSGLYREDYDYGKDWNMTEIASTFSIRLKNTIDDDSMSIHNHLVQSAQFRVLNVDPPEVCTNDNIRRLMNKTEINDCLDINSLQDFHDLSEDKQLECIQRAADAIVNYNYSMNSILTALFEKDETSYDPVATVCNVVINNFNDLQTACQNTDCDLCADHPEYICAADLLARRYLKNDLDVSEQTNLMILWTDVIRESYLAQQFKAWNNDTEIRKSWQEGAAYTHNSATLSIMNYFNQDLLSRYNNEVLDVQHNIMAIQFTQTTLEILSQSIVSGDAVALNTARQYILNELTQTWKSLAASLEFSTRQSNIILQNDAQRLETANESRPYLFDLYYSAVLESAINQKADHSSLNAAYNMNLSSTISNLESLDQAFESPVFMRDGEVLNDTRMDMGDGQTMLNVLRTSAGDTLDKARLKRESVFRTLVNRMKEHFTVQDNYLTSMESLRAELVSLCGYPSDCQNSDQRRNCRLFTTPYFCGFSLKSIFTDGVSLDGNGSNTISQIGSYGSWYNSCVATLKANTNKPDDEIVKMCSGGNLLLETDLTSIDDNNTTSQAGVAILKYRQADIDYSNAQSEYDILSQKIRSNYATLEAYALNIEEWYREGSDNLSEISKNLQKLKTYEAITSGYHSKLSETELNNAQLVYTNQADSVKEWNELANSYTSETMNSFMKNACIADLYLWIYKLVDSQDFNIIANTDHQITSNTFKSVVEILRDARSGLHAAMRAAESTSELAKVGSEFSFDVLAQEMNLNISDLQTKLAEDIDALSVIVAGIGNAHDAEELQNLIDDMKHTNDLLLKQIALSESYQRDLRELESKRNEFKNNVNNLIPLAHTIKIKEIAKYRALIEYLTIAQHADFVASQYDTLLARYQLARNSMFLVSDFFVPAPELYSVESFIENARENLSDYLTAIEYLTVRPFVELRRAIYTARGTNDLEKIYEQLNDLPNECSTGTLSPNKFILSLREQLGITNAEFDNLRPEDRFNLILSRVNLPVSTQTRSMSTSLTADVIASGDFSSVSFNIGTQIANISSSCNAKINGIRIRLVSKPGKKINENNDDAIPSVDLIYSGQTQLLSCHLNIEHIVSSVSPYTTYGLYSTFSSESFADGINVGIYEVSEGENYTFDNPTEFDDVTVYNGLNNYPLMSTYSIVIDPSKGSNDKINWDNVADIEVQIDYTTNAFGASSGRCNYDLD